jgi:hypothetical protein
MRSRRVSRRDKKILQFKKLLYDPDLEPWLAETFAAAFQMRKRIEEESSEDANGLKREVERALEDLVKGGLREEARHRGGCVVLAGEEAHVKLN